MVVCIFWEKYDNVWQSLPVLAWSVPFAGGIKEREVSMFAGKRSCNYDKWNGIKRGEHFYGVIYQAFPVKCDGVLPAMLCASKYIYVMTRYLFSWH